MASSRPPRGSRLPQHRPISRPEDRPAVSANLRRDPRLGPAPRCLSRGSSRSRGGAVAPSRAAADAVAAREATLRRLQRASEAHAEAQWSFAEVRRELIDVLLHVRLLSLDVVEAIERWRSGNSRGATVWPDPTTGQNYLLKMKVDTQWLPESPLGDILNFSSRSDPFFVVPSAPERSRAKVSNNMMTPTLRAQRQNQGGEQRRAVLPLQASLLKRIREAELVIVKESVQARIQQQAAERSSLSADSKPSPPVAPASGLAPWEYEALAPRPVEKKAPVAEGLISAAAAVDMAKAANDARVSQDILASQPSPSAPSTSLVTTSRPRPARPSEEDQVFRWKPVDATHATIQAAFEGYIARVQPNLVQALEQWPKLADMLENEGTSPLEWFWLHRNDALGSEPDGLVVFRMVKKSMIYAELLHVSVTNLDWLGDAIASALCHMFAWMPIKAIRCTLWYTMQDGDYKIDKSLESVFKGKYFKWFQLTNSGGLRGQVMNRPRAPRPDGPDPEMPADTPSVCASLGQAWLLGAVDSSARTRRISDCALSLMTAALCLSQLWDRSSAAAAARETAAAVAAAGLVARKAAREAIFQALLSGELDKHLAHYRPVDLHEAEPQNGPPGGAGGQSDSVSLTVKLGKMLEKRSSGVPGARCEASNDAAALVSKCIGAPGYGDAIAGLGADLLPDEIRSLAPRDAVFCQFFVTLDWANCMMMPDADAFEMPVHAVGSCPSHSEPVVYLATAEEDVFVVVIPCGNAVPREDVAFSMCTDILRNTQPLDPPPYATVRLRSLVAQQSCRLSEISDAPSLQVQDGSLHVAEFGSWAMSAGRLMPGRLKRPPEHGATLTIEKPYCLALWHEELDDLNAPLLANLVV